MRIDVIRPVLTVILDDDDQSVARVGAVSNGLNQQANSVVIIRLLQFRRVDAAQSLGKASRVIVTETTNHLEGRQIAVGDKLLELAIPFVEAPNVGVGLIVSPEVRIIESVLVEKLIGRRGLYDACGKGVRDRVSDGSDPAWGVGHPAVVTDGSAGV